MESRVTPGRIVPSSGGVVRICPLPSACFEVRDQQEVQRTRSFQQLSQLKHVVHKSCRCRYLYLVKKEEAIHGTGL
jgi:hypothetical protein